MLSRKQGCAIGCSGLRARAKKAGIEQHANNFSLTPQTIQDHIREAYKRFNRLKADPERRDTWIAGLIQAQSQEKGRTTKSRWKQHREAEKARKTARLVRATLQPSDRSGALTKVIGPTQNGRQEVHTKTQLEKACLEEAGRRFTQANVTPLLQPQITKQFGEIGTNRTAFRKALAGKLSSETHEDTYVEKLLNTILVLRDLKSHF